MRPVSWKNLGFFFTPALRITSPRCVFSIFHAASPRPLTKQLPPLCVCLPGFQVLVDDVDIEEMDATHLRRHLALVQQEPQLFSSSVHENIAFGSLDDAPTRDAVRLAARCANADDFVMAFANGYVMGLA